MKNKKALGQHWLKNRAILEEIADLAAGATPVIEGANFGGFEDLAALSGANLAQRPLGGVLSPLCIEIGPGLGTLTASLLRRFQKVVAVEFDAELARKLPGSFPGKNLEVVNEDILGCDIEGLVTGAEACKQGSKGAKIGDFVVAGNIPYYITSPIIEKLLNLEVLPRRIVLLIQKEVAERIAGEKESLLALSVKNRAEVALGPVVSREEFTPPPKVDSRVLVLTPHAPEVGEEVFQLIRRGFSSPRKKLVHNLAGMVLKQGPGESKGRTLSENEIKRALTEVGIGLDVRPGDLHLEVWKKLESNLIREIELS